MVEYIINLFALDFFFFSGYRVSCLVAHEDLLAQTECLLYQNCNKGESTLCQVLSCHSFEIMHGTHGFSISS